MIAIVNASYRNSGLGDQIAALLTENLRSTGGQCAEIKLRGKKISFCTNCRSCMRDSSQQLGRCVLDDDCAELLEQLDQAERIIVISPINFYDLTALFKQLLERMTPFGFWPADSYAPKFRRRMNRVRSATLITTSAMPGPFVPLFTNARRTFRYFCKTLGVASAGYLHIGLKGRKADMFIKPADQRKIEQLVM